MSEVKSGGKKQQLKVNQLLTDLQSGKEATVAAAIKALHVHGDESVIIPVLDVWKSGLSDENDELLFEMLIGLKDTKTIEPLINAYRSPDYATIKRQLTMVFWNSKLDFSPYLSDFVLFAIEGDFMDAFEALTLIEHFENQAPESAVMESQLLLKEYFGATEARDEQKDVLLTDIAILLKDFDDTSGLEELYLE